MILTIEYPSTAGFDWSQLALRMGPHLLWAILVFSAVLLIGPKKIVAVLLNARKISFAGIEIELQGDLADAGRAKNIDITLQSQDQVSRRILRLISLFSGTRLLWIDDNPSGNENEIRLLRRLGVIIDLATNDVEARRQLGGAVYDLVLSDMGRGENQNAGEQFMPEVAKAALKPPIVFYVGRSRATPVGAFGLTMRPDHLFNLIMDALERRRA